jgi:hypothetical protein
MTNAGIGRVIGIAIAVGLGSAAGCTSTTTSPITSTDAGGDAQFFSCDTETRATREPVGLDKTSKMGTFDVKVTAGDPDPAVKGTNTWTVQINDATATPVDGLTVKVTPFMPDHNHGTSVKAAVTPMGSGGYSITPLYLYMAGYWEITLDITPATGSSDSVVLPICIQG